MATHRVSMINWGTKIRPTGGAYFGPYTELNAGSALDREVLILPASVVSGIEGSVEIPENYVGTPKVKIVWTSETTANDVDFDCVHRTVDGSDTELLDTTTVPDQRTNSQDNNGGPSAASERMVDEITLTDTDITGGATWHFEFERDGASDTKADDVSVWGLEFTYSDA